MSNTTTKEKESQTVTIDIANAKRSETNWLVQGLIPTGVVADLFGPPGIGKSTILTSLALAIAAGDRTWAGLQITNGKVVVLGGEKSSESAWAETRDKLGYSHIEPDRFYVLDCPPILAWDKRTETWMKNDETYTEVTSHIQQIQPILVVVDTIARIAIGQDVINYAQQALLGITLESIAKQWQTTIITVSHSNQSSSKEDLPGRLDWMSRTGGSGLPGILRLVFACTDIRSDDYQNIDDENIREMASCGANLVAFCASKANEFMPVWHTRGDIAVFEVNDRADYLTTVRIARTRNKKTTAINKDKEHSYENYTTAQTQKQRLSMRAGRRRVA